MSDNAEPSVNVETAERVLVQPAAQAVAASAQPKPGSGLAAIMSPDSAIRAHPAYQVLNRMWRPAGGWVLVVGMLYGFAVGPYLEKPLGLTEWGALVALVVAMWGLKTLEKRDGVA